MVVRIAKLAIVLGLLWLALWGALSMAVPKLIELALPFALPKLARAGIAVDSLSYETIDLAPTLLRIRANVVDAAFDLTPTDSINLRSSFDAQRVTVKLDEPTNLRGSLFVEGFEVAFHEADRPHRFPFERLTDAELMIRGLPLLTPRAALREARRRLEAMLVDSTWVDSFALHGTVLVTVKDQSLPARLYTERRGDDYRLRFEQSDVQRLVEESGVDLSTEQIELISLFPVRVPSLIAITRQARRTAWESYPDERYLRDALRHVVWSYLLTSEFGTEFAKEVTDAQETRSGNTANERAMDYHNNAVGRRLATDGTTLQSLPRLVAFHPDVIRHPREVDSRQDLLR